LKTPITKRPGGVTQGVGPEFKPQYHKEKKKVPCPPYIIFFKNNKNPSSCHQVTKT
jgi:hypothetical protein